ncbi:MAG: 5-formyltetrahydrofolate cyclo-ligase [Cytophagales bacterium]|nr:5-formyltetrahydrofolate cyclo-ligase [Cytophagales bacterium]
MAGITAKALLRKEILRRRKLLSHELVNELSLEIQQHFLQWIQGQQVSTIHSFLPIERNREVNTWPLIDALESLGKCVILTRTNFETETMDHFLYETDLTFEEDKFKIPTPVNARPADMKAVEVVLVPLLAADKAGGRIGYGKGYYDRLIQEMTADVIKIGLTLGPCFDKFSFLEPHDQKLDYCITPYQVIDCYE